MDILEEIRQALGKNKALTKDFKYKIFEFVIRFNEMYPNVNLENLKNRVSTVTFEKIGQFEKRGTFVYEPNNNKVLYNVKRLKDDDYDVDNLLMKAVVAMASATDTYYGFNKEEKLYALNRAITEMIATSVVGNEGISDYEEEVLCANLISKLIGVDTLVYAYFNNDADLVLKKMIELEV